MPVIPIPQPQYPIGTPLDELPTEITRRCCPGKLCTTEVDLRTVAELDPSSPTGASVVYTYDRGNGETFFCASTVDGLIEKINDPSYWPVELIEEDEA